MSGGVIGTGSTNWNQAAPAAEGGSSGSKMYYVYWAVTESSAGSGSGTPTFGSTVYTATNFVGLVKFSGTNTLVDGSGTSTTALVAGDLGSSGTTTIDGGRITTGTISSTNLSGTSDGSDFSSAGMRITMSNGAISSKNFRIGSDGTAEFKGTVKVGGTTLSTSNTLNENTVGSDLGGGYGDNSIGGLTLASTKIYIGTGTHNNSNTAFYVDNSGNFSLKDKLSWDGTTLSVNGNITIGNASSIDVGDFNDDGSYTDDTVANTKTTASEAAAAANSQNKTGGSVGGWSLNSTTISSTNIELNSTNKNIVISDSS